MVNAQDYSAAEASSEFPKAVADQARDFVSQATGQARQVVNDAVSHQLSFGTEFLETIAEAARAAASKLQDTSPQVAGLVRAGADRVEDLSQGIKDRSPQELLNATLDFSRRNPAVVFGSVFAAALIATRILSGVSTTRFPPRNGYQGNRTSPKGEFHGA
jgi:hypothetical protein